MDRVPTSRYLNLELEWPHFRLDRLEITPEGHLRLARLPHLAPGESVNPAVSAGLTGPAGVGVDSCGHLYVADSRNHRILRVDACDGSLTPLRCVRGPGDAPGSVDTPRGVLVGRGDILYVADAGNRRVQLFDLGTGQLRGIWDRGFEQPWDLAQDSRGRVYVADPGRRTSEGWTGGKVTRFARDGADTDWTLSTPEPGAPTSVAIAVLPEDGVERLLVLDREPPRLLVYGLDGAFDEAASARWTAIADMAQVPASLVVANDGIVHLADLASGQVFTFASNGRFLGVARGLDAGAAGIGLDCRGRLAATPGGGTVRQSLQQPAFVNCGTFLAGPFDAATEPTRWQRIHLDLDPLPEGAHMKLWTLTSTLPDDPGMPVDCAGNVTGTIIPSDVTRLAARRELPARPGEWRELPWDATDGMILNEPGTWLWIAGMAIGNGLSTPTLRQARLVHDDEGWLRHLPALYSRDETSRTFLQRALGLFETLFNRERALVEDLPRLFDPWASPDEPEGSWLEWLADWVGTELDEAWEGSRRRATVANAFHAHGLRGTRRSLQQLVALHAGASVVIDDAAAGPGLWGLDTPGSGLGFDTALAPVPAGGAVLAASAIVDHSTLASGDPRGRPAFGIGAHCFTARVYSAEASTADALDRVRRVLDREKPAHTSYHLCRIEPAMRVGMQAVLGIDSIVAAPPSGGRTAPPSVPATVR